MKEIKMKKNKKMTVALLGTMLFGASTATAGTVGIFDDTVIGGALSAEALAANALGHDVDIIDNGTWMSMTTEDFAAYDALIFGDPYCLETPPDSMFLVDLTTDIWTPAVTGNVIVIGADPYWHSVAHTDTASYIAPVPGALTLMERGIAFAAANEDATGAYIALSCYYKAAPYATPVSFLTGFTDDNGSEFAVTGADEYDAMNDV
ncbi:MAG: hypothetical protein D3923_16165, partial [Candidatus Electrothrix sp. AR3]|nr:hypothetical protein [Candidatus Electrothrix sp. AR3]